MLRAECVAGDVAFRPHHFVDDLEDIASAGPRATRAATTAELPGRVERKVVIARAHERFRVVRRIVNKLQHRQHGAILAIDEVRRHDGLLAFPDEGDVRLGDRDQHPKGAVANDLQHSPGGRLVAAGILDQLKCEGSRWELAGHFEDGALHGFISAGNRPSGFGHELAGNGLANVIISLHKTGGCALD